MDRPVRPGFRVKIFSSHLDRDIETLILVPDGTLPMDLYNALLLRGYDVEEDFECWITNRGRIVSPDTAAELAFDEGLVDERKDFLSTTEYTGSWRRQK